MKPSVCHAVALLIVAAQVATASFREVPRKIGNSVPWIPAGTSAVREFETQTCTPLTPEERVYAYGDLGKFHHAIVTSSSAASKLFNQGLMLEYNFNQPEAKRSFLLASQLDPACAMCYWGIAYSLGPYANKVAAAPPDDPTLYPVFTEAERQEALAALVTAESMMTHATSYQAAAAHHCTPAGPAEAMLGNRPSCSAVEKEQAYITAMKARYAAGVTFGPVWEAAEKQYARDMAAIAEEYEEDSADAYALAAEALMNLSPWDFYNLTTQQPNHVAQRAEVLILKALERAPTHPLASHLYVHLTEGVAGRGPKAAGRAEPCADVLGSGTYLTLGHLTHMGSHNFMRVGRWHDGVLASIKAVETDRLDAARCLEPYDPQHNMWMLLHAASMGGELAEAEKRAKELRGLPEGVKGRELMLNYGAETAPLSLLWARYARWDSIRADLPPGKGIMAPEYQQAVYQYTQLLAAAARVDYMKKSYWAADVVAAAKAEVLKLLAEVEEATRQVPQDTPTKPGLGIGIYSPGWRVRVDVALLIARARVAVMLGNWSEAEQQLYQALPVEASDGYMEPPRQYQPVRQCLGWVLLHNGKWKEAAEVYEEDLGEYPENGWSLKGLMHAYIMGAKSAPPTSEEAVALARLAARARQRFDDAWEHADDGLSLVSSCPTFSSMS